MKRHVLFAAGAAVMMAVAVVTGGQALAASRLYPVPACEERAAAGYAVTVDGAAASVQAVRHSAMPVNIRWPGHQRELDQTEIDGLVRFVLDGTARVVVTAPRDFREVKIRPLSRNVRPQVSGRTIEFELTRPGAYSVELDGIHENLHVFAETPPDYRVDKSMKTRYYGPGEHDAGVIELKPGETLFLDEGAVVFGRVYARDADHIRILGRGILDMSRIREQPVPIDPKLAAEQKRKGFAITNVKRWDAIKLEFCDDVKIDGIVIRDSLCYNIRPIGCRGLEIGHVKIIGNWRYNSDGIDMHNCENVHIHDCFLRTFDDAICVKGFDYGMNEADMLHDGYNHNVFTNALVERCTVWCDWGRSLEFGAETRAEEIRDITFRDCDLVRCTHVACDVQNCDYADIHDVLFDDIRVELDSFPQADTYSPSAKDFDPKREGWGPSVFGSGIHVIAEYSKDGTRRGRNRDITVRNLRVTGPKVPRVWLNGYDAEHRSSNIVFDGVYWNGREASDEVRFHMSVGKFADPPRFLRARTPLIVNEPAEHFFVASAKSLVRETEGKPNAFTSLWDFRFPPDVTCTEQGVERYVDALAGGNLTHFFINVNYQRSFYPSQVIEPIWASLDEPDRQQQPFIRDMRDAFARGFDAYAVMVRRCRERGVSPWLSFRMNDIHGTQTKSDPMTGTFWREHPEWHLNKDAGWANGLDYAEKAVRDRMSAYIREAVERYDVDGVELDLIRFPFYFRAGTEKDNAPLLTAFVREIRKTCDAAAARRGHPVKLAVRLLPDPKQAEKMGADVGAWAREGLVDLVIPCNMYGSIEYEYHLDDWRELLGNRVRIVAGTDNGIVENGKRRILNLDEYRRWIDLMRRNGSDGVYFFNFPLRPYRDETWRGILGTDSRAALTEQKR